MKKQSGFTLIELMVVMAIIAILATAGLSAYTGYIKKARDATRIADIGAINTITLALTGSTGLPPQDAKVLYDEIVLANNGQNITDPQDGKKLCYMGSTAARECAYTFRLCDGGLGFAIGTRFESTANTPMYSPDDITVGNAAAGGSSITTGFLDADIFEIGNCTTHCTSGASGCPASILINPVKIDGVAAPGTQLSTSA